MSIGCSEAMLVLVLLASAEIAVPLNSSRLSPVFGERAEGEQAQRALKPDGARKERAEQFSILIKKGERKLYLYDGQRLLKTYRIALGGNPKGTKKRQGDGATPEGDYYITHKNARSNFYLSLGLSYPNVADADAGLASGLIARAEHQAIARAIKQSGKPLQNTRLGGDIFIHGGGVTSDWTLGCVALENQDIKELFDLVPVKTPVKIVP